MKSVINRNINVPAYPMLKEHNDSKVIVLFTSEKYGLVIHSGVEGVKVGDTFFKDVDFITYKGSITLSNY